MDTVNVPSSGRLGVSSLPVVLARVSYARRLAQAADVLHCERFRPGAVADDYLSQQTEEQRGKGKWEQVQD